MMKPSCTLVANYKVLIAIQNVGFRVIVYSANILEQQIPIDIIIVIQETAKITLRRSDSKIGILSDALVLLKVDNNNTAIQTAQLFNLKRKPIKFRARINQHKLEFRI